MSIFISELPVASTRQYEEAVAYLRKCRGFETRLGSGAVLSRIVS